MAPGLTTYLFALTNRLLPKSASQRMVSGRQVAHETDSKVLRTAMQLGHKAAGDLQPTDV